jgi:hypothetical protein
MKSKLVIYIGGAVLLLLTAVFILRFVFGGPEDDWICTDKGWVRHGNPSVPIPTSECNFK